MRIRRYLALALSSALLVVLGSPVVLLTTPQVASAVSTYDDILGTAEALPVACRGGSVVDMSEDWFDHMLTASPNNPTLLKLREKLDNGETSGWALKANRIWSGTPTGAYDTVTLYVTSQYASYTLDTYYGPESGYRDVSGITFSNADYIYAYTYYTYYQNSASITCGGSDLYSTGGLKYNGTSVVDSSPGYVFEMNGQDGRVLVQDYSDMHYLFFNAPFVPPYEYEGIYLPSTYVKPPPVAYSGTVDCGGDDPQHMLIYQSGNDGAATLTYESLGRATWEYSLSTGPYSIAVDCEGTWAFSYGIVYPFSTSGDWVCDPYTVRYDQPYCVLS